MYAVVNPDDVEAARRLGNMFHTLEDALSVFHVHRVQGDTVFATNDTCKKLKVKYPVSMNVVDLNKFARSDETEDDILAHCAVFWAKKALQLWIDHRSRF